MLAILLLLAFLLIAAAFMRRPEFGSLPTNNRLERVRNSPHYQDGKFRNQSFTPDLSEGVTYYKVLKEFLFSRNKRSKPAAELPSRKTDLQNLDPDQNLLVWFGHSSYFMQLDGKTVLVDPVLSGAASPLKFTTPSFGGSDVYTPDELPTIDVLFISHDHWDHLDYDTITRLRPRVKQVITGLGVGAHLERWGYDPAIIHEKDWNETVELGAGFTVHTTPARHFSGRGFKRAQSLWSSFVLQTPTQKIFIGGDSGYDTHFARIGAQHGPFDLAVLECGQYNTNWKYIHLMPEEAVQAALDLRAKKLLPVHWSKFVLGQHDWDEPIIRVAKAAKEKNLPLLHPLIGEAVDLREETVRSLAWWEGV